jgi:uncharacterized protein (DUF58 family)
VPASRGAAAGAGAVVLYVAGWLLGYPELCLAGAATALAVLASAVFLTAPVRLTVRREIAPARIARGEAAVGVLYVTNAGRRASRACIATDRCGGRALPFSVPRLRAGATRASSYRLPTLTRGVVPIGPLTVTRGDPFGFFRRAVEAGERATLVVRPRTVPLALLASGHAASLDGPDAAGVAGGTTTFHSLREYVAGDDQRHIHWRSSARAGTLMVRQLVDASEPHTTVLLDTGRDAYRDGHFETAVDIAASVAVAATGAGFGVSVLAGGDRLVTGRGGQAATEAALDLLALVTPGAADLTEVLPRLRTARRRGSLIAVTGAAGAAVLERVAAVAAGYERTVIVRAGTGLPALPEPFGLPVIDAGTLAEFAAAWHRASRR